MRSRAIRRLAEKCVATLIVLGAANATHAGTIIGGSSLLNAADIAQLETWLGQGPLALTNVYTKMPGDDSFDFHSAANWNAIGPTFSIIEVLSGTNADGSSYQSGRQVIGGYNPQAWGTFGSYRLTPDPADMTAFIFNLTQGLLQEQVNDRQTYNDQQYGPSFGDPDIVIRRDLSSGNTASSTYCAPGTVTKSPTTGCFAQFTILNESPLTHSLVIGAIEIFAIAQEPPEIAEPGTLALYGLGLAGLGAMRRRKLASRATAGKR